MKMTNQPSNDEHSEVNDEDESTVSSNRSSDTSTSSSNSDDDDPDIHVEGEADSVQEDPHVILFYEEDHLDNETDEQHNIEIDDEAQSTAAEEMIEPNTGDLSEESTGVRINDEELADTESAWANRRGHIPNRRTTWMQGSSEWPRCSKATAHKTVNKATQLLLQCSPT